MHEEFLRKAQEHPPVLRALQELKAMAEDAEFRKRYEARRRALLEMKMQMQWARNQGLAEGKKEMIHLCERLLNRPQTPAEQLTGLSLDDLTRLADDLQEEVLRKR